MFAIELGYLTKSRELLDDNDEFHSFLVEVHRLEYRRLRSWDGAWTLRALFGHVVVATLSRRLWFLNFHAEIPTKLMSFNNSFIVNILAGSLDQDQGTPPPTVPHRQALASVPCLIQRLPPCSTFTACLICCTLTIHIRFSASRSRMQCKPSRPAAKCPVIASGWNRRAWGAWRRGTKPKRSWLDYILPRLCIFNKVLFYKSFCEVERSHLTYANSLERTASTSLGVELVVCMC